MRAAIDAVKKVEKHAQGTISYTTSPLHSIDVLAKLADDFTNAGCDSIAIKDMAGIMTPTAAAALVTAIKARTALPVHVHAHATSGLAAASLLAAVNAGASIVDTVISSFAEGASHPATESIATALEDANFTHGVDANLLDDIALYFRRVRGKYWQFESPFTGVDSRVLKHHVPGGMISNLTNQLREQNALDKIDEVLEEIPRVRHDLGYPPLVTPSSQIVGAQAVLNVVLGERYKMVSNEVKNYLLGQYGRIPGEVNAELYAKAVGDDDTAITCRPADLLENGELERLRSDIGQVAKSDEDVLTYAMFPELAKTFLQERAANALVPEALLPHPETKKEPEPANAPSEFNLTVHGETYHIRVTGAGHKGSRERPFYMTLDGVPTEIMLETLEEIHATANESVTPVTRAGGRPRPSAPGHVATAMPGTVLELLVKLGDAVKVGTPLLIMEAMKMENEIQAAVSGQVTAILVQKGDAVTPDEILMEIGE
jgi:pyruvate carboxylase subunit B